MSQAPPSDVSSSPSLPRIEVPSKQVCELSIELARFHLSHHLGLEARTRRKPQFPQCYHWVHKSECLDEKMAPDSSDVDGPSWLTRPTVQSRTLSLLRLRHDKSHNFFNVTTGSTSLNVWMKGRCLTAAMLMDQSG